MSVGCSQDTLISRLNVRIVPEVDFCLVLFGAP